MKTPREKYITDNQYKFLVDTMVNQIEQCNYTPSEMREAAILASIIYEETYYQNFTINVEMEKTLDKLYSWANTPAPHNVSMQGRSGSAKE